MFRSNNALSLAALSTTMALSACGDGSGGGVTSTPAPPPPSYTKVADLTGSHTFQTGGVHWQSSPGAISGQGADAFGKGVTILADGNGAFTVTEPGGTAATFTAFDVDAINSTATTQAYSKVAPSGTQQLRLTVPTVAGVALSYTVIGFFLDAGNSGAPSVTRVWTAVGGVPTLASDMPRTGTATYTAETSADVVTNAAIYASDPTSTATFAANFGAGTVQTSVHLFGVSPFVGPLSPSPGTPPVDFGTFTGTGTIAAGGPGFAGSFAGTTGAGFSGAFFGPQAQEMAYSFNFAANGIEAFGATRGVKH